MSSKGYANYTALSDGAHGQHGTRVDTATRALSDRVTARAPRSGAGSAPRGGRQQRSRDWHLARSAAAQSSWKQRGDLERPARGTCAVCQGSRVAPTLVPWLGCGRNHGDAQGVWMGHKGSSFSCRMAKPGREILWLGEVQGRRGRVRALQETLL